jgi:hypothetical protein
MMTFKAELVISIFLFLVDALARLGFSILVLYLLDAVFEGNYTIAFIYCAI